jgi:hypothetical protein
MAIKDFFSNDFGTSDFAKNERLLTRYYRNDYKVTKNAVINVAKKLGYEVVDTNDQFKELLISGMTSDITISIIAVSYYEMAVDLHIVTHYLLSMGRGINHIEEFYNELDRNLTFIHKGARNNG